METLLTVSVQGGIVILAVAALRLMLKRAPKRAVCLLWLLAGLRLLLPFQIESSLSLQPRQEAVTIPGIQQEVTVGYGEILNSQSEIIAEAPLSPNNRGEITDSEGSLQTVKPLTPAEPEVQKKVEWNKILPLIYLLGLCAMTASSAIAYLRLRRRVADSVIFSEGVWVTGNIDTAFVLGFFRPEVYLPVWLDEQEREFVLAHERSHIARRDHWWKLLGYITLSIHWFNPLVWLGYILLCRDLEMACDENVIKTMDLSRRKAYSAALVSCSAVHPTIAACPVAFGEVSVKERVKRVLNFKKPGFWITLAAILAAVCVGVTLLTSPVQQPLEDKILESLYAELEALQGQKNIHLTYTIELDSEFEYVTKQHHEVWVSGEDWYHEIAYETPMGSFTEGYMQLDGFQYATDHSDEIEGFENRPWAEIPEENYSYLPGLLRNDFSELEVAEIREEELDDGGKFSVVLRNDYQVSEPEKMYENSYTFRLDAEGKLTGITKYTYQYVYMSGFGQSGYFDTKTEVTFQIRSFAEADYSTRVKEAQGAVEAANEKEQAELELALERKETERLRELIAPDLLLRCQKAVEEFQSKDAVCVTVDNQFSGDILNDSSNVEYYQNGDNWLIRKVIENSDFRQVWFGAQVDGLYRERESYDLTDPANGENQDSGWVEDVEGEPMLPWLCSVKWEDLLITDAKVEYQEGMTWYHLTVIGPPYEMAQEVREYKLTFVFREDVFQNVILEYDMTWSYGKAHVVSTIKPETMRPEEIDGYIRQICDFVTE